MTAAPALRIAALYRYPVKGLSPEALESADLETSGYFPGDRLYAIENGPSGFNEVAPRHLPKVAYLMLMRNEALARLRTRFDPATHCLIIEENGREAVSADLSRPEGRDAVADFMRGFVPQALRGAPRVLASPPGYRFTDARDGYVSLVNRASVAAIEDLVGAPVDPLRFRANLYLDGLEAWAENDLLGTVMETPGGVRLKLARRTVRCAAVNVDPQTGIRDLSIPPALSKHLGHSDCGVYAEVLAGGVVRTGDALTVIG
ncbi:MOSC domain-containing protein [Methylobacterium sp. Leaf118]|uniref:MOSC domain-containing protein n=1 Tax=Methylobacterium sp. Leaf118 TaxID=2876562 RepID=UPI001E540255|nr:MOSC N-terminal beta barrel domain-containing protein [Methylobacterium sp. Leaf118]